MDRKTLVALQTGRVEGILMARNGSRDGGGLDPELQEDRQERTAEKRIRYHFSVIT